MKTDEDEELEREASRALLVRDRSRYACNYASDMLDERLDSLERERYRARYENAKCDALLELLAIKDDLNRGVATHGVIDLLISGKEADAAKRLFATVDEALQDSIVSTDPDGYAFLRAT